MDNLSVERTEHPRLAEDLELLFQGAGVSPNALRTLSDFFNEAASPTPLQPGDYFADAPLRRAYSAYYLPMTILKLHFVFDELRRLDRSFFHRTSFRVLDVGAGPVAGLFGFFSYPPLFQAATPAIVPSIIYEAHDKHRTIMSEGLSLFQKWASQNARLTTTLRETDLTKGLETGESYDLVLLVNTVCELDRNAQTDCQTRPSDALITALLSRLKPDGYMVILEPALKKTSRRLHDLHDRLLTEQRARIVAPCVHQKPCPLVTLKRDWCHELRRWNYPSWFQRLDSFVGHKNSRLLYSFLILSSPSVPPPRFSADTFRIISEPMTSKGKIERVLCGERGRFKTTLLKRDQSEPSRPFAASKRGDILRVPNPPDSVTSTNLKNEWRLDKTSPVLGPEEIFRDS